MRKDLLRTMGTFYNPHAEAVAVCCAGSTMGQGECLLGACPARTWRGTFAWTIPTLNPDLPPPPPRDTSQVDQS